MEVLIVCALLMVVLNLVFKPLLDGLGFTKNAQTMITAQDNSRTALSQISSDLSSAMYVYDTGWAISCPMTKSDGTVWTDASLNYPRVPFAKMDMVLPMMQGYCTSPNHPVGNSRAFNRNYTYKDPTDPAGNRTITDPNLVEASPICPFDHSVLELRPVQPMVPDKKIVRYFIALRDPTAIGKDDNRAHYVNPYAPFNHRSLTTVDGRSVPKNMYVLYRAEFVPGDGPVQKYNDDGTPAVDENGKPIMITGNYLFPKGNSAIQNLSDPDFFYRTSSNGRKIRQSDGSVVEERYCDAWKRISRIVVTPDNMDLVTVDFDAAGNPHITPTVKFTPTAMHDDPLVPTFSQNSEDENGNRLPTIYKATYGNWTSTYSITLHRRQNNLSYNYYTKLDTDGNLWIYRQKLDSNGEQDDPKIFNITKYQATSQGYYQNDPSWKGYEYGFGRIETGNLNNNKPELAFTINTQKGLVDFGFPHVNVELSENTADILGGKVPVSCAVDTRDINDWYTSLADPSGQRKWLLHLPGAYTINGINATIPADQYLQNSVVVPGMEKVFGPNANPGPSFGMPIQYTRVPFLNMLSDPGINQYKLDTAYLGNDMPGTAALLLHSESGQSGTGQRLPQLDPTHMTVAGKYDTAYSDLVDSDGNTLPGIISQIYVLFYEQNNAFGDSIRADYVTKSVITINMGIRVYDSGTGKPYNVQLTNKITLKNNTL